MAKNAAETSVTILSTKTFQGLWTTGLCHHQLTLGDFIDSIRREKKVNAGLCFKKHIIQETGFEHPFLSYMRDLLLTCDWFGDLGTVEMTTVTPSHSVCNNTPCRRHCCPWARANMLCHQAKKKQDIRRTESRSDWFNWFIQTEAKVCANRCTWYTHAFGNCNGLKQIETDWTSQIVFDPTTS